MFVIKAGIRKMLYREDPNQTASLDKAFLAGS